MFAFLKNIGTTEWIILGAILILIFGSKALISLGKTGGETFREIKKIKKSFKEAVQDDASDNKQE